MNAYVKEFPPPLTSFGGVDNFLSNCASSAEATNLGNGGSDHDALSIVFTPDSN